MEAGPSLNLERVALVHGGLRHGAFEHPNIHSLHLVLLTARVSWPWRQALVEREAQLEAAILQQPEVWQLLAQEAPAITGPGGGMWPSNPKCRFPSKWIKLWLFYIYIYVICYYNGEKDDKLTNHYCIVCRLCMMLHTHMWNKGKRAARVDVVREKERESWRGETVWVIEFHLTFIVTNIFVGVVLHGFAGVTWKHKFHAQCYCILLHTEVFPGKMHHELM